MQIFLPISRKFFFIDLINPYIIRYINQGYTEKIV